MDDVLNIGEIVSVQGTVVDVCFSKTLPDIHSILSVAESCVLVEVLAQLDHHHVRGITLKSPQAHLKLMS